MFSRTYKIGLFMILFVAMMVVAGCQTELERAAEATVQVQQQNIEDFFALAEERVTAAVELAGGLPSQEARGDLIVQDLQEIQSRLSEAVEQEAEEKVAALEAIQQQVQAVRANIQETIETAVDQLPEETQDQLKQLESDLEDLQQRIQDEANAVREELGQEVEEAEEAAEDAAADAQEEVEETAEDVQEEAEEAGYAAAEEAEDAADIVDTAVAAGDFTTLVAAVEAAGLVDTLKGEGPFTVFAPTDEAFAALPAGTVESLLADPEGTLTDVLLYHVIAAKVMAADAVALDGEEAETVGGAMLPITVDGDAVMVGDAMVIATDIETANGVIHVIDAVLVPPAE